MKTKNFDAKVKAVGPDSGLDEGQFEAIVSVFGNEDTYGDVVVAGAFKSDLDRWAESGDPLPVIWSHDWADPFSHVGTVIKAEERPEGLWVKAQMHDMDTNPKAAQVYNLLKGRRVKQFSFAYDVVEGGFATYDGREVYELRELKVHEVGPCLLGVNQETELLTVKAHDLAANVKAGREVDMDAVRETRDTLSTLLEEHDNTKASDPSGSAEQTDVPSQADGAETKDEGREVKSEESPRKSAPRRALAVARITNLS